MVEMNLKNAYLACSVAYGGLPVYKFIIVFILLGKYNATRQPHNYEGEWLAL